MLYAAFRCPDGCREDSLPPQSGHGRASPSVYRRTTSFCLAAVAQTAVWWETRGWRSTDPCMTLDSWQIWTVVVPGCRCHDRWGWSSPRKVSLRHTAQTLARSPYHGYPTVHLGLSCLTLALYFRVIPQDSQGMQYRVSKHVWWNPSSEQIAFQGKPLFSKATVTGFPLFH